MVVRVGITTGLMESGPSEANWFLARNAGEGETVTSDQFLLEETEEWVQACISLLLFFSLRLKPTGTLSCKLATSKEPQIKAQKEVLSNLRGPRRGPMLVWTYLVQVYPW